MNNLPLYNDVQSFRNLWERCSPKTNRGLWYDKFFHHWAAGFSSLSKDGRTRWIADAAADLCGDRDMLVEHVQRQEVLAEAMGGVVLKVKNESRFVSGMGLEHPVENGFSWHHILGTPFISGSSLKGMALAWAKQWRDEEALATTLFGSGEQVGKIAILDMLPTAPVRLCGEIMTPHYGPYYQGDVPPADWHDPVPIQFLGVEAGQLFQIVIVPVGNTEGAADNVSNAAKIIADALEWIGAGAKTGIGMGRFHLAIGTMTAPKKSPLDEFKDWFEGQPNLKAQKNRHGEIVAKLEALENQEPAREFLKTQFKKKECTPKLKTILWG